MIISPKRNQFMIKTGCVLILLAVVLCACGPAATAAVTPMATATETVTRKPSPTALPTITPSPTLTPLFPVEGYGPSNFPADVDPLTGLKIANPSLLQRRPMLIKVSNLPRNVRPQWGLSLADIVFEYYAEEGSTRFAAIFYGNDASMVGPIRSGRFIDYDLVRGYKAVFAFGSAYVAEMQRFNASDFANRMVVEEPGKPLTRYDPNGYDYLMVNTADLSAYAARQGFNRVQNLNAMSFKINAPAGGQAGSQVFVHYSGAIYNRWDYDAASGRYLRFVDQQDDVDRNNEVYAPLVDKQNNQPVAADNLVVLLIPHQYFVKTKDSEVIKMAFTGSGTAYAFRDGKAYLLKWQRSDSNAMLALTFEDGTPYSFKPGNTWFEVMGASTGLDKKDSYWRFTFSIP